MFKSGTLIEITLEEDQRIHFPMARGLKDRKIQVE